MKKICDILSDNRYLALCLCAVSVGILSFAYVSQYVFHYDPCILCLYQRKPYFTVIALSVAAFFLSKKQPRASFWLLAACGAAFLVGAGIALYHTGVEQTWWKGTQACGDALLPTGASIEELRQYLENKRVTRCDVPSWKLFGFSMTNYNLVQSILLSGLTFFFLFKKKK